MGSFENSWRLVLTLLIKTFNWVYGVGMSHGFMQMTAVVSESLLIVKKMGQWIEG